MDFNEILIFVNGNDLKAMAFAHAYQDRHKEAKIILVAGKVSANNKRRYYFDTGAQYVKKFKISKYPSIVLQKDKEKHLTIYEICLTGDKR
jgi:hypothetical protein